MTSTQNKMTTKESQIANVMQDIASDKYIVHTTQRSDKKFSIKISPTGDLTHSFEVTTPPMLAQWPRLHADGNHLTKFAQEQHQAVFEANVSVGTIDELTEVVGAAGAETLFEVNNQFADSMDAIFHAFEIHLFHDKNFLMKKKKNLIAFAKKQVANTAGIDIKTLKNNDERVVAMAMSMFKENANKFVNRDKETPFIRVKRKVFQTPWGSDASVEATNKPVPIFDASGTRINGDTSDTNSEALINGGDLVSAKFSLRPYIIPSGAFGITASLTGITKIKEGSMHRAAKRRKSTHSFSAWAV